MPVLPNAAANAWTHYAIVDDGTHHRRPCQPRRAGGAGGTYNFGRYDFPGLSLYSLETRGLDVAT